MPEYCPVRNFETYLQKLHPQCNRLWQFPTDIFNISDECWFQKRPIRKDTLASFMFTSTVLLLLFFEAQMRETENVHIYPVCFPNIG
jgi:hypothetical protein